MRKIIAPILVLFVFMSYANNSKVNYLKEELKDSSSPAHTIKVYRDLSRAYYRTQIKFDSAFYYTRLAYDIAQREGLQLEKGQVLFDQASIFRAVGDIDKAIDVYNQSLKISKEEVKTNSKATRLLIATTNNMGDIYLANKDFENAKKYFRQVIQLAVDNDISDIEAIGYLNLAEINYLQGNYPISETYINRSAATHPNFRNTLPHFHLISARTYAALNKTTQAEEMAIEGIELAQEQSDLLVTRDLAEFLSEYYKKQENYKAAHTYGDILLKCTDSLNAGANRRALEKLILEHQLQEQENKLGRLAQKNKYLTTIYALAAGGVLLLIVLMFRQRKITRMTRNIHDIQNSFIKSELDKRKSNPNTFDAAMQRDEEYVDPDFI